MDKKDGNLWLGILAGWWFFGNKKKQETSNKSGGFLGTIVYFIVVIIFFNIGLSTLGFILLLPFIIGILLGVAKVSKDLADRKKQRCEELYMEADRKYGEGLHTETYEICQKLIEENDYPPAYFGAGVCLIHGQGVSKDFEKGIQYIKQAAEQGFADAQVVYARHILDTNQDGSFEWIEKAAKQNNLEAQFLYGLELIRGEKITKDIQKGINLIRKSAEAGIIEAQEHLGHMLYDGTLTKQDYENAVFWFKKAMEAGSDNAQAYYGLALFEGNGIEKNAEEGKKLIIEAQNHGCDLASEFLAKIE